MVRDNKNINCHFRGNGVKKNNLRAAVPGYNSQFFPLK